LDSFDSFDSKALINEFSDDQIKQAGYTKEQLKYILEEGKQ